jgi:hypothetical protein
MDKVQDALPEVLGNRTPGPKPRNESAETPEVTVADEGPTECPKCGGKVTKNGTYWVLNWFLMLSMGWLGIQRVCIQRRRCKACGHEIISPERARQAEARRAWWCQVARLVSLSRFKLGLSVRRTQILVGFVYARQVSIGYIERLMQRVGKRAETALARLSECRQAQALFLLYDETYPKMKKRAYSLGGDAFSVRVYVLNRDKRQPQIHDAVEYAMQGGLVGNGAVEDGCAVAFVGKGEGLVNWLGFDDVIVVEDNDKVVWEARNFIEQVGQNRLGADFPRRLKHGRFPCPTLPSMVCRAATK